jgi:asparagine synthase (glutamine-hydrolysing)|tara:strand:- start:149 stop:1834 length:1686 start_codon:yes stop_codon:yes gene_type:complete
MCGISGITQGNQLARIYRMMEFTKKRGPDGSSTWTNNHVSLGHNLLAIYGDIGQSLQPYLYKDSALVFNGAIYNHKDFYPEYDIDTHALARGLYEHGVDFLKNLEGMWSLAFYKDGKLIIARDHFGVKPLFYRQTDKGLIFSSSIKALENKENKLNLFAFALYRHFGYVPGWLTLIDGTNKLTPGQWIQYDCQKRKQTTGNTWDSHKFGKTGFDKSEFKNNLEAAIKKSHIGVRQRGIFLSGGLDSTSVAHYLDEKNTFTSRYVPQSANFNDDADVAMEMAKDYKFNHKEIEITPENYYADIDEAIEALEQPVFNKSTPSYFTINKYLRDQGTIVTYSGDGGDEMYTGYGTHGRYENTGDVFRDHYRAIAWKPSKRMNVTNPQYEIDEKAYVEYMHSWFPKSTFGEDHLNNCMYVEMLTRVSEDFLTRNDKFGSYFGMEGRFPLLNQKFYKYIMDIESSIKMENLKPEAYAKGEYKYLARESLKGTLPDYVVNKPKTGWSIPDNEWRKTQQAFREKMVQRIREPLGNKIDQLVDWDRADGVKTFYAAAFFKTWAKNINLTV